MVGGGCVSECELRVQLGR